MTRLQRIIIGAAIMLLLVLPFIGRQTDGTAASDVPLVGIRGAFIDLYDLKEVYFARASWVEERAFPYDQFQEYPPLAVLYLSLPRLFTQSPDTYAAIIIAMNMLCFAGLWVVFRRLLRQLKKPSSYAYVLLLPSFLFFTLSRFDILVTLCVASSVLFVVSKRYSLSMLMLIVAALCKWYALVLLPLFFLYCFSRGESARRMFKMHLTWLFVFFFVALIPLFISGAAALTPYAFHFARGIEGGGILNVAKRIVEAIPGIGVSQLDTLIGIIGLLSQLAPVVFVLVLLAMKSRRFIESMDTDYFFRGVAVTLISFSLFGKIYSPQWELWWLPFAVLAFRSKKEWIMIIIVDIINYLQYPIIFSYVGSQTVAYDAVVVMRTFASLFLAARLGFFRYFVPEKKTV